PLIITYDLSSSNEIVYTYSKSAFSRKSFIDVFRFMYTSSSFCFFKNCLYDGTSIYFLLFLTFFSAYITIVLSLESFHQCCMYIIHLFIIMQYILTLIIILSIIYND